jgi:hypothetical protein
MIKSNGSSQESFEANKIELVLPNPLTDILVEENTSSDDDDDDNNIVKVDDDKEREKSDI